MIVSNSTPLIYLAKVQRLDLLKALFREIYIPLEVKKEVVDAGKKQGKDDAFLIEKEIDAGWIKIKSAAKKMKALFDIHAGEKEAISLALEHSAKTILLDDVSARTAAKVLGLKPRGTIYVLLQSIKKRLINFDEFLSILSQLTKEGFRLHEEIYTTALEEARRLSKKHG